MGVAYAFIPVHLVICVICVIAKLNKLNAYMSGINLELIPAPAFQPCIFRTFFPQTLFFLKDTKPSPQFL